MEIKSNGCFPGTWKCQEPNIGHSEIQKYLFRWFVITNIKQGVYQVITGLSKYNFCNLKFDVHGFVSSSLHALKRSLHFCYTFLYSSSSWQQAEPGEARFGKSWLHEPLPGASVQREIKKRCHDLIAETFPQTSLMKMFRTPCFDQTVTWFFPFGGWNGKNAQQLFKPIKPIAWKENSTFFGGVLPSVWKKYAASNWVFSPMFGQKITKIFFKTTICRYSNGCMYPNPFMKFNFNVIHAVLTRGFPDSWFNSSSCFRVCWNWEGPHLLLTRAMFPRNPTL